MSIIKWEPFQMDDLLDDFLDKEYVPVVQTVNKFVPPINIYDDKDNVYVDVAISGYNPENIEINVQDGVLTIKGNMEKKREIEEKNYYRKEIRMGSFARQIALPTEVYGEKSEANFDNGVLKISIPKKEEIKSKKIEIKIAKK